MNASEEIRQHLRSRDSKLSVGFGRCSVAGVFTIEAIHEWMPMPLGIVWFGFVGAAGIQIDNSFVDERYRRCGVRTYLHEQLLAAYPDRTLVISGGGTASGRAWMKATGYKKTAMGWEYRRKKGKP